ncbi:MAG: hypothetical protein JWP10_1514 [Nocardioidaceae bacterium]|nr:hypothetical protein [Nocardioidaceae bacterium]
MPIRLIGGPLDGQTYGDVPIMPGGHAPSNLSVPLGEPGPGAEYAHYKSGDFDPETEMLLFNYVGTGSREVGSSGDEVTLDIELSRDDLMEDTIGEPNWDPASRFVIEQSWWIGSELCRRHPNLRLYEMHPADGMYDILRVFDPHAAERGHEQVVDMNRAGRIHLHNIERFEPISWRQVLGAHSPHDTVKILETLRGWNLTQQSPSTTPTSLTYRVIAGILTRKLNDRHRWDTRSAFLETHSQSGGGVREDALLAFPVIETLANKLRDNRTPFLPPESRLWVLQKDSDLVLLFDDRGFAHSREGAVIDLMAVYKRSKSLEEVIGCLPV